MDANGDGYGDIVYNLGGEEKMKNIKIWFAASILLLMVGTASAGISMEVTSIDNEVLPGEIATYKVNISYFMDDPPTEHVVLSIDNPIWSYTYDPAGFDINTDESKYSTLSISVPTDAQPGTYEHTINATATAEIIIPPIPPITIMEDVSTTVETTVIPEFTTIAIPVAAIFGIVLLMQRRRKQK